MSLQKLYQPVSDRYQQQKASCDSLLSINYQHLSQIFDALILLKYDFTNSVFAQGSRLHDVVPPRLYQSGIACFRFSFLVLSCRRASSPAVAALKQWDCHSVNHLKHLRESHRFYSLLCPFAVNSWTVIGEVLYALFLINRILSPLCFNQFLRHLGVDMALGCHT